MLSDWFLKILFESIWEHWVSEPATSDNFGSKKIKNKNQYFFYRVLF